MREWTPTGCRPLHQPELDEEAELVGYSPVLDDLAGVETGKIENIDLARSMNETAPSAASTGSFRATFLVSACACLMRWIAGCDFHPNDCGGIAA